MGDGVQSAARTYAMPSYAVSSVVPDMSQDSPATELCVACGVARMCGSSGALRMAGRLDTCITTVVWVPWPPHSAYTTTVSTRAANHLTK